MLKWRQSSKIRRAILSTIWISAGIFLAEIIAMVLVSFHTGAYFITILIDATITTLMVLPLVLFFAYQPLANQILKLEQTEAALQVQNTDLLSKTAELEQTENILRIRLRMMQIAPSLPPDDLLQAMLDEIEAVTGSSIGFFHFLEPDQKTILLQAWSTNTVNHMCRTTNEKRHYPINQAGVWAECARLKKPVVHNDYKTVANRRGMPEGHAEVARELTVPIIRNDRVVAIMGVGNKPGDYTDHDLDVVSTLADFFWDIVERHQAEATLAASEEKFRTLVDWTYDWEKWVDPTGNIVYTSPSCERITGYSAAEFVANPRLIIELVHPADQHDYARHHAQVHDENAGVSEIVFRVIRRDGEERWIEHMCRPLFSAGGAYLGRRISNRDITMRKQSEFEIEERNKREIELNQTIQTMQMEIARDLHDTLGQNISFLRMKLDHLASQEASARDDLQGDLENLSKSANESYELIRDTLAALQLEGSRDLNHLLAKYARRVADRSSLAVTVNGEGKHRLLPAKRVRQLFYIFREAISNAELHARASRIEILLAWCEDQLQAEIVDDGQGFKIKEAQAAGHYGLKFMHERVTMLGGSFSITSRIGSGTKITMSVPYENNDR